AIGTADRGPHAQPERVHAHPMRFLAATLMALFPFVAAAQATSNEVRNQAAQQVERQRVQPLNNAPVWREVRSGIPAETAVIGRETNVLIQPTMKLPGLPAVSAGLADMSKALHNFTGPVFAVFLPILIAIFIRDNLPKVYDLEWMKTFGGMLSKEAGDAPSGRFNAGEKILFWVLPCFLSVILVATGFILDFPNFDQTRSIMQQANLVHLISALLGITVAFFHIYLGTIGQR